MTHAVANPHEELARQKKAYALADELSGWEHCIDLIESEQADQSFWNDLAKAAGVNPPSEATIDLTISIVRRRATREAQSDNEAASGTTPAANDGLPSATPADRPAATTRDPLDPDDDDLDEIVRQGQPADPFEGLTASPGPWGGLG